MIHSRFAGISATIGNAPHAIASNSDADAPSETALDRYMSAPRKYCATTGASEMTPVRVRSPCYPELADQASTRVASGRPRSS